MGLIRMLQDDHSRWLKHNFPGQNYQQAYLGMVEEVGELAHVELKHQQRIRGSADLNESVEREAKYMADIEDCIADLFIFTMSYCNSRGIDLEEVISDTWARVRERDWIAYPKTGLPEESAEQVH